MLKLVHLKVRDIKKMENDLGYLYLWNKKIDNIF
jgi:hypothetical protein